METIFVGCSVVVAEDDEVNAILLAELLECLGATVSVVADGAKAVSKACEEQRPNLVLMDCNMPEMDGWQATKVIRQYELDVGCQRIPIVAITAAAHESDKRRCFEAGMDDWLPKPYDVKRLIGVVTPLLQRGAPHPPC